MDPNSGFRAWLDAVAAGEHAEALEHARNLTEWLDRGGFEPDWTADEKTEFRRWVGSSRRRSSSGGGLRLVFFPANQRWAYLFGDNALPIRMEKVGHQSYPVFFGRRADAVDAARAHGLTVDRRGRVHAVAGVAPIGSARPRRRRKRKNPIGRALLAALPNPKIPGELWLWAAAGALGAVAWWAYKQQAPILELVKEVITLDTFKRGARLTDAAAGPDGVVDADPAELARQAGQRLGRILPVEVYSLARMIRSEGAAAGRIRGHVALNDARELGWNLHQLLTYSTNPRARGRYGQQYTPAELAPGHVASKRRYATTRDPYAGDVQLAELVLDERSRGIDPTGRGVKFVDKSSMGVQAGSRSYAELVAKWGAEGLRPYNVPGYSEDLVVFRRA